MKNRRALILLTLLVLIIGIFAIAIYSKPDKKYSLNLLKEDSPGTEDMNNRDRDPSSGNYAENGGFSFNSQLTTSTTDWEVGKVYEVRFETVGNISDLFDAATVVVTYDPAYVKVNNIVGGDVWEKSNIIYTDIDNSTGKALIDVGREFESDMTNQNTVVVFEFQAVKSSQEPISIYLSNESFYTFAIDNEAFSANPLQIRIN